MTEQEKELEKNMDTIWQVRIDRDWGMRGTRRYYTFFMKEKISDELLLEKIRFLKPDFEFNPDAEQVVSWNMLKLSEVGKGFAMYDEVR
jgi:hypothetical protein